MIQWHVVWCVRMGVIMGQQSSRQLTTWSWYKPSLAKLYEIVLLARSSLFVQLFLKLHLSNHIPSDRVKCELPTHYHVKTCHTQNHPTEEPTDAPSRSNPWGLRFPGCEGWVWDGPAWKRQTLCNATEHPGEELIWWKIFNIFLCNSRCNFISNHSWDSFREMGCRDRNQKARTGDSLHIHILHLGCQVNQIFKAIALVVPIDHRSAAS